MMYKSQFQKIDPYDWFCGPGSQIYLIHEPVFCIIFIKHFCAYDKFKIQLLWNKYKYIKSNKLTNY